MGKIVNKREMANILGKSERILTEWQKDGMPVKEQTERGKSNQYDTEEVIRWLVERATIGKEAEELKLRMLRAQTRRAEAEADVMEGTLIPEERVQSVWVNMTSAFRQKMLAMPNTLMHSLEGKAKKEIFAISQKLINGALEELADYDPEQYRERATSRKKGGSGRRPAS